MRLGVVGLEPERLLVRRLRLGGLAEVFEREAEDVVRLRQRAVEGDGGAAVGSGLLPPLHQLVDPADVVVRERPPRAQAYRLAERFEGALVPPGLGVADALIQQLRRAVRAAESGRSLSAATLRVRDRKNGSEQVSTGQDLVGRRRPRERAQGRGGDERRGSATT